MGYLDDFDLYSELKKISKAVDMITMKLVKAKVIQESINGKRHRSKNR